MVTLKQLSNKLKLGVVKCYIYTAFLYEAITWAFDKNAWKKIKALEM
jgi:hypothetical protein